MISVILELEYIASLRVKLDEFKFIHLVEHFYKEDENVWQGKVIDNREMLKITNEKIKVTEGIIKGEVKKVGGKMTSLEVKVEESLKKNMSSMEAKVEGVLKKNMSSFEEKVEGSLNSMDAKISSLDAKMGSIEGRMVSFESKLTALFELFQNK